MKKKNIQSPNDGINIVYYAHENPGKPWIILAAGLGQRGLDWEPVLEPMKKDYSILSFDLRGVGESDKPSDGYSPEFYSNDIKAILDAEGLTKVHTLGLSYGGMVVQDFYNRFPEYVKSLILVSTSWATNKAVHPSHPAFFKAMTPLTPESTDEEKAAKFQANLTVTFGKKFLSEHAQEAAAYMMQKVQNTSLEELATIMLRMQAMNHFANEQLNEIKVPVLILHGKEDLFVPIENGRFMHLKIPNAHMVEFDKIGHHMIMECPDCFLDELKKHIQKI